MGHYQGALDYIFHYVNYERQAHYRYDATTFDLGRMIELLDKMGRPHERFQCVHIAGTKGKGSTSAMTESVLRAAGFRTGLYTSPHLHTFRERIRVGGELIPKQALVDVLNRNREAIETTAGVTAFEVMTALAFAHFADSRVEWAVLEVGLGGRLDATNVARPAVCGITSLSYDHTDLLGHTLSLIAWEKAGIAKAGVPLVSAPQETQAMEVIEQVCGDIGARLVRVGVDWTVEREEGDLGGQTLTVRRVADNLALRDLRIRLLGRHQITNAATAVAILAELNAQGVLITEDVLRAGLLQALWPGRFEVLQRRPVLVVDSAHNADSARKLQAALADCFPRPPRARTVLVFGASADKDIDKILEQFLRPDPASGYAAVDRVIVTQSGHPRSASPEDLVRQVRAVSPDIYVSSHHEVEGALHEATTWAEPHDLICVTGSIFVVAQARRAWAQGHPAAFSADDWVFQDETAGAPVPDDTCTCTAPAVCAGAVQV